MKHNKIIIITLMLLASYSVHAEKRTIYGLGLVEKSLAGESFMISMAKAEARQSLAEQATLSEFNFSKDDHGTRFIKTTSATVSSEEKPVKLYSTAKGDMGIVLKGTTDFNPQYDGEICKQHNSQVKVPDDLKKAFTSLKDNLYQNTVQYVVNESGKTNINVSGTIYTKEFKINVDDQNIANLTTTVCVAELRYK